MSKLSLAAQAVLEASGQWCYLRSHQLAIAAALRAAADQVLPKAPLSRFASPYEEGIWHGRDDAKDALLALAAELDPTTTTETTDEH